jgi:hypothetical protein
MKERAYVRVLRCILLSTASLSVIFRLIVRGDGEGRLTIEETQRTKEEEWEDEVAKHMGEAFLKTRIMRFEELVPVYKAVEAQLLARLSDEEFLILETRRRVAEQILHRAAERCSLDVCREYLRDLLRLGFTDASLKCTAYISYSMRCEETGHADEGVALLEALDQELGRQLQNVPIMLEDLRLSVRKRLAKMRHGQETQGGKEAPTGQ